jgi:predicted pyridoxine 5'-phosphate oxidase superfamily flavin-nucleotide-binding protein
MVQMTPEMMDAFRAGRIFPLATASKDGEPNVALMWRCFSFMIQRIQHMSSGNLH